METQFFSVGVSFNSEVYFYLSSFFFLSKPFLKNLTNTSPAKISISFELVNWFQWDLSVISQLYKLTSTIIIIIIITTTTTTIIITTTFP